MSGAWARECVSKAQLPQTLLCHPSFQGRACPLGAGAQDGRAEWLTTALPTKDTEEMGWPQLLQLPCQGPSDASTWRGCMPRNRWRRLVLQPRAWESGATPVCWVCKCFGGCSQRRGWCWGWPGKVGEVP